MDSSHSVLLTHHIKPDYGFYVQSDDRLFVAAYSSVASLVVRFSGYFLDARGEVNYYAIDVAPTSDRAVTSGEQIFGEGFLLSCTAHLLTGNANRGQCYVRARIQRGTGATLVPIAQILGGYVTDDFSPSFPFGKIEGSLEGPGMLRSVAGTNVAANTEITEAVPTGALWRLRSLVVVFVTAAGGSTRRVTFQFDDGTTIFLQCGPDRTQAASTTVRYSVASVGLAPDSTAGTIHIPIPPDLRLPAASRIITSTTNLAAADDFAAPQLQVEEWIQA